MNDCNEHPDNKVVDGLVNKAMTDEWQKDRKVIEAAANKREQALVEVNCFRLHPGLQAFLVRARTRWPAALEEIARLQPLEANGLALAKIVQEQDEEIKELEGEREESVKRVLAAGMSTGHASTLQELFDEVLDQAIDFRGRVVALTQKNVELEEALLEHEGSTTSSSPRERPTN